MRYLSWLAGVVFFLLALGFAIKNTAPVLLHFYLGYQVRAPLSLLIFLFLIVGMILGVSAALVLLYRQRREIVFLKRELNIKTDIEPEESAS